MLHPDWVEFMVVTRRWIDIFYKFFEVNLLTYLTVHKNISIYALKIAGARDPMDRWEFCIESTRKFFSYGLGSLYERSHSRLNAREKNIKVVSCIIILFLLTLK